MLSTPAKTYKDLKTLIRNKTVNSTDQNGGLIDTNNYNKDKRTILDLNSTEYLSEKHRKFLNDIDLLQYYDNHVSGKAVQRLRDNTANVFNEFLGGRCITALYFVNPLTQSTSDCEGVMEIDNETNESIICNRCHLVMSPSYNQQNVAMYQGSQCKEDFSHCAECNIKLGPNDPMIKHDKVGKVSIYVCIQCCKTIAETGDPERRIPKGKWPIPSIHYHALSSKNQSPTKIKKFKDVFCAEPSCLKPLKADEEGGLLYLSDGTYNPTSYSLQTYDSRKWTHFNCGKAFLDKKHLNKLKQIFKLHDIHEEAHQTVSDNLKKTFEEEETQMTTSYEDDDVSK